MGTLGTAGGNAASFYFFQGSQPWLMLCENIQSQSRVEWIVRRPSSCRGCIQQTSSRNQREV